MIGTRHEEYSNYSDLPFIIHINLERTPFNCSKEKNWHEDLEIELCTKGSGAVLINGEEFEFNKDTIIAVNSNAIHYTYTDTVMNYPCIIISAQFCKQIGIDYNSIQFKPIIESPVIKSLILELTKIYSEKNTPYRTPKLNKIIIELLIQLAENHSFKTDIPVSKGKEYENVKSAIKYIRENYSKKITLDEIAKYIYTDKYSLCKEFKKMSGQTVMEYTNNYRCRKAADCISDGCTIADAALKCGFSNISYFTKTFKKCMGVLPSEYRKNNN